MLGSPFGVEDESCNRPNPAVPTWHADALFRFQVGLADDLIGYLIPAWGFASGTPGLFNNDTCYQDMNGHGHKLESESVGPTRRQRRRQPAGGAARRRSPTRAPTSSHGRFVLARRHRYSRWPTGAVGVLIAPPGDRARPGRGTLIGGPARAGFGARQVDATRRVHGLRRPAPGPARRDDARDHGARLATAASVRRYYLERVPRPRQLDAAGQRLRPRAPRAARARLPGAGRAAACRSSSRARRGRRAGCRSQRERPRAAAPYHPGACPASPSRRTPPSAR